MKEMMELGKKVKTYILIILICSKRKRNISIRRREMEDINGSPKEDKTSQIEILLDTVNRRLESTEEIFIKLKDIGFIQNELKREKRLKKEVVVTSRTMLKNYSISKIVVSKTENEAEKYLKK